MKLSLQKYLDTLKLEVTPHSSLPIDLIPVQDSAEAAKLNAFKIGAEQIKILVDLYNTPFELLLRFISAPPPGVPNTTAIVGVFCALHSLNECKELIDVTDPVFIQYKNLFDTVEYIAKFGDENRNTYALTPQSMQLSLQYM
jgi:hypothetical protein